jgi:serine/threonine-protein kinase
MGTALYVSPEQATGSTVTGASDVYSLGVVAYECLAGEPPFIADQPLAIAIMHKHDPVPPLPADVPKPVSDLVLTMLAKTPEGRPESAQHVADRADVIRDARVRSGVTGQITADLPVVPDFPSAAEGYFADPERTRGFRLGNRRLAAAGAGVALCGVGAIVAILLTSGGNPVTMTGTTSPTGPVSQVVSPAEASLHSSQAGGHASGTNLVTGPQTSQARSAKPTPSQRQSPKPAQDASPTSAAPTASASKPTSPSAPASTTTSSSPSTGSPTPTPTPTATA